MHATPLLRTVSAALLLASLLGGRLPATPPEVARAIAALERAAAVYDEPAMRTAAQDLTRLGPASLVSLTQLLTNENANVRWKAVEAITQVGVSDPSLCAPLVARAHDRDADVRAATAVALARLFPNHTRTHATLGRLRQDPQPLVRVHACGELWRIQHDTNSLAALIAALSDPDWMATREASRRLARIGDPATPALLALLKGGPLRVRTLAIDTLAAFERLPGEAVAPLVELAWCEQPVLSEHAMLALAMSGTPGASALRALCSAPTAGRRARAVSLLGTAGPSADIPSSRLLRALCDDAPAVRLAGLGAIARLRRSDRAILRELPRFLRDRQPDQRAAAVAALEAIGPAARAALPALRQLAQNERVDYIRRAAEQLVQRLALQPSSFSTGSSGGP